MSINFITTAAYFIPKFTNEILKIRETEYIYSLAKIFSYNVPVYGVVSETHNCEFYPYTKFPYNLICNISNSNQLDAFTKSDKEYVALQSIINKMNCNNDEWIIKVTGRYLITDDILINRVKESNSTVKAFIYKICENNMVTYFYAMRFSLLKKLLEENVSCLNSGNIEAYFYIKLHQYLNENEIVYLDKLGIFTNINNENNYTYI
jgi:hypothetical protein